MSCAIGDDERLPAQGKKNTNARDWMKGWEEGALHACERIAFVGMAEAQRELQAILETHRDGGGGRRRPGFAGRTCTPPRT
tara:strand:- start:554 stop:796 length:243 start_codon:yes stop_codon:yes gene_type:complete